MVPADPVAALDRDTAGQFDVSPQGSRLGELLVSRGAAARPDIVAALIQQRASGKRLGSLLVEVGAVPERDIVDVLADQLGVPRADLAAAKPEPEALALVPEATARSMTVLPMRVNAGVLEVAVAEVSGEIARALAESAGREVRLLLAASSDIRRLIERSYTAIGGVDRFVRAFEATTAVRAAATVDLTANGDEAPVVQVVNLILAQARRDRASDVHIEPQADRVRVRFRIDGTLHDALALPSTMGPPAVSRLKIMGGMNIVERRRPQDGKIATTIDGRELDIRVSTVATIWGEKCVLRILDKSRPLYQLGELGMAGTMHDDFSKLVRQPFGMAICAGPTGSGKTTTLYATLAELNEPGRNIMTVEDPVEYVFPSINQIQTNEQAGITFAAGLRSILRQDPDVILVGEVRDVETARIAVQSALTGHFVLSSLHATDAVAALHRFLDMGIEAFLVASSVVAVVGQRLVRRTCLDCREPYVPTDEELAFYRESGGSSEKQFYRGAGCVTCSGTGYRDRIGVYELLRVTPELKRLIVGWATQEELRRVAVAQGMRTLLDEGIRLVDEDVTTPAEILRSIYGV